VWTVLGRVPVKVEIFNSIKVCQWVPVLTCTDT